jgi:hypothetical protein
MLTIPLPLTINSKVNIVVPRSFLLRPSSVAVPHPLWNQFSPPPFAGFTFADPKAAAKYRNEPVWRPITGVQGIDEAKAEYRVYIEKIYNALIDIRDVWDKDEYPGLVAHFAVGGRRNDPMALEAIA